MLALVPNGYREAALALGVSKWKTIVFIVLKTAGKGIITGVLLACSRVAGETAPLLFTDLGNQFWSRSLSDPIASLPRQIYTFAIGPRTTMAPPGLGGRFDFDSAGALH